MLLEVTTLPLYATFLSEKKAVFTVTLKMSFDILFVGDAVTLATVVPF